VISTLLVAIDASSHGCPPRDSPAGEEALPPPPCAGDPMGRGADRPGPRFTPPEPAPRAVPWGWARPGT
jgi:hypothetical protein